MTSVKELLLEYRFPEAFGGTGAGQERTTKRDSRAVLARALRTKLPALRARVRLCQWLSVALLCVLVGELVWRPDDKWLSGAGVTVFGVLLLLWRQAWLANATEMLIEIAAAGDRRTLDLLVDKLLSMMGGTPPLGKTEGVPAAE